MEQKKNKYIFKKNKYIFQKNKYIFSVNYNLAFKAVLFSYARAFTMRIETLLLGANFI